MNRRLSLYAHPDFTARGIQSVDVELARPDRSTLALRYTAVGDVLLPAPKRPARTDGLWQHTCFEAFIRAADESYFEFNLSPSSQWASYRFDGPRMGMAPALDAIPSVVGAESRQGCYVLDITIALEPLRACLGDEPWFLGLSAVIETSGGEKSYWALAHPPGKPDFHNIACFAEPLPGA